MKKLTAAVLALFGFLSSACLIQKAAPVKVGVLHSLTGTLAIGGKSLVDATLMAIDEVNASGGLLDGRRMEAIVVDAASDPSLDAKAAAELVDREDVSAIFGCWTSACRKAVKGVIEKRNVMLMYPLQHEGLEESKNIFYTGAVPNQQIIPAVKWFLENKGKRVYLIGSDYIFPRAAHLLIRDMVAAQGGEVAGEMFLPMGTKDVGAAVDDIRRVRPDVVFNTINGDTNLSFFTALKDAGFSSARTPVVSFSIAEEDLRHFKSGTLEGHYAVWNYFQSIPREENRRFVESFKRRYGADRVTDDPMESAYISVKLWANAVNESGFLDMDRVRTALMRQSLNAPEGIVSVEPHNLHLWKPVNIGRITSGNQFEIIWTSERPVRPFRYPRYRPKQEWETFMKGLQ